MRTRAQTDADGERTLHGIVRRIVHPTSWAIPDDLPDEERSRSEAMVTATLVLAVSSLTLAALVPLSDASPRLHWIFLPSAPLQILAGPVLYRFTRSLTATALLQSGWILACIAFLFLHEDGKWLLSTPWLLTVPLYGTYIAGRYVGLALTLATALVVALGYAAHASGLPLGPPMFPDFSSGLVVLGNNLALVMMGALGFLYEATREGWERTLRRAIGRLSASEASLVTVFDNMADGICWVDDDLTITMLNGRFQDLVALRGGRPPEPGTSLVESFPDHQHALWVTRCARALAGSVVEATDRVGDGDDEQVQEITLTPLVDATGRRGFTLYVRDVTERARADARLRQANRKLVLLSRKAGLADQATGLLHDLRNALNGVFLAGSSVREGLEDLRVDGVAKAGRQIGHGNDERIAEYLVALGRQLEQRRTELRGDAAAMTEALEHVGALLQAQQTSARAPYAVERASLERVVEAALAMHAPGMAEHGIEVLWEAGNVGDVPLDRHRVLQILGNLLRNAVDALSDVSGRPRRLWVRTAWASPAEWMVEVRDNGVGIAPDVFARLFDHGFTTKARGHGFGLHAAAAAARDLGGSLTASSEGTERGATFCLRLPRVDLAERTTGGRTA